MTKLQRVTAAGLLGLAPTIASAQDISQDIQPIPAELMPLAGKSLLLDVVDTGERLIAVGERGHVVASLDAKNWAQAPTPTRATLNAVDFTDEKNGWAVGHDAVILHTQDGGRSWVMQNFEPEIEKPFLDILMLDAKNGFAIGAYSLMYSTSDGGKTWDDFESPIREDEWHFNAMVKLNNGDLFIAGEAGTLAISQDGGSTWSSVETPYDSSLFGAAAVGEAGVAIFGLRGNAFYSVDPAAGEWTRISTGQENSLIAGTSLPNGEIIMVGINGVIFETTGGLSGVRKLDNPAGITLAAVQPVKDALIVAGEAGTQIISQ